MTVSILFPQERVELEPGEDRPFGRVDFAENHSISHAHGIIHAHADHWAVSSTGSYYSFTIFDCDTPSRLAVPLHTGPIRVPFSTALIAIEIHHSRYTFTVAGPGIDGWTEGWRSVLQRQNQDLAAGHSTTVIANEHLHMHWRRRSGAELRWFQMLVAFCEPRLTPPFTDRLPTYQAVAGRLNTTVRNVERQVDKIREQFGLPKYASSVLSDAVVIAINQGLVTASSLDVLAITADDENDS